MQNHVFIKEVTLDDTRIITAYTTLKGLLESEAMTNLYRPIRYHLLKEKPFRAGSVLIYKIQLFHNKHSR